LKSEACFLIGNIYKAHGLKGEVSVYLLPEAPLDFSAIDVVYLLIKGNLVPYFIEDISIKSDKAYVKLEEVDTKESAEGLKGTKLYLPLTQREMLPAGEFYEDELVGLKVSDTNLGVLGVVLGIEQGGLAKLMLVDFNGRELLIPMNSPLIVNIDLTQKSITVNLPEGYLEI
jgi:16S rRNA processing protein RimM